MNVSAPNHMPFFPDHNAQNAIFKRDIESAMKDGSAQLCAQPDLKNADTVFTHTKGREVTSGVYVAGHLYAHTYSKIAMNTGLWYDCGLAPLFMAQPQSAKAAAPTGMPNPNPLPEAPIGFPNPNPLPRPSPLNRAQEAVKAGLEKRLSSEGVVTLKPGLELTPQGNGVFKATGVVDVNALWGGDMTYRFSATIDVNTGALSHFKRAPLSVAD